MTNFKLVLIIYFISIAIYGCAEIFLQLRFSNWKFKKADKDAMIIMVPFYLSIYLAPVENIVVRTKLFPSFIILGSFLLFLGLGLRITGLLTIKNNFSMLIEADDSNRLVRSGIYKYIRHPLYLAILIISLSGSIIFSCIFNWIIVVLTFLGVLSRIKKEEIFLSKQYPDYEDYKNKTKKLIPFVFLI
jgi:protein-S-isoprenylcysteine O-methyltransferase Ste14